MFSQLRYHSAPVKLPAGSELFKTLASLQWKEVINHCSYKNCLAVFEGKVIPFEKSHWDELMVLEDLQSLRYTVRIDQLHIHHPVIKDLCRKMFMNDGCPLNCSLYLSPNNNSQGMLYHSDDQNLLTFQLEGEKRWRFPYLDGLPLKDHGLAWPRNAQLNLGKLEVQMIEVISAPQDMLFVPSGSTHMATNMHESVSAHLTFAEEIIHISDVSKFLAGNLFGFTDPEEKFFELVDMEASSSPFDLTKSKEQLASFYREKTFSKFKQRGKK